MKTIGAAVLLGVALVTAVPAGAEPFGPICPGDGDEVTAVGVTDGYCDFMFTPDGNHVHCKWAGFSLVATEFGGVIRCRRVSQDGSLINPDPVAPPAFGDLPPLELNSPGA